MSSLDSIFETESYEIVELFVMSTSSRISYATCHLGKNNPVYSEKKSHTIYNFS